MKQTSIPALAAAAAALFAGPAAPQGSTTTQIPDCVLQCRPWFIEQVTNDCETDCLAHEVDIEFQLAAAAGDPYVARFSLPDCGFVNPCPYGGETFTYQSGATVVVGAGLWSTSTPTGSWLGSGGGVVQADFYVAPVGSVVGVSDMAKLPWQQLPPAHFDPFDGFWKIAWPTAGFDDPAGYFLRVDMLDSLLGPINAYTLGVDPTACGFHPYGELVGGANVLSLSMTGEACAGKTAVLTTKQTAASKVFTAFATAGDYLPMYLGAVLVDLHTPPLVLTTPTVGGVATQPVAFPPNPTLAGMSLFVQSLAFDSSAPLGLAFSNAVRIDFCTCP